MKFSSPPESRRHVPAFPLSPPPSHSFLDRFKHCRRDPCFPPLFHPPPCVVLCSLLPRPILVRLPSPLPSVGPGVDPSHSPPRCGAALLDAVHGGSSSRLDDSSPFFHDDRLHLVPYGDDLFTPPKLGETPPLPPGSLDLYSASFPNLRQGASAGLGFFSPPPLTRNSPFLPGYTSSPTLCTRMPPDTSPNLLRELIPPLCPARV